MKDDSSEHTFEGADGTNGPLSHTDKSEGTMRMHNSPQWNLRERFEYVRENWTLLCWLWSFWAVWDFVCMLYSFSEGYYLFFIAFIILLVVSLVLLLMELIK